MSNRAEQGGEQRLLRAVTMMVRRKVEQRLPAALRGLRGVVLSEDRIAVRVDAAVSGVIGDIVKEVLASVPESPPDPPSGGPEREVVTIRNDIACAECGSVSSVATLRIVGDQIKSATCERCRPLED